MFADQACDAQPGKPKTRPESEASYPRLFRQHRPRGDISLLGRENAATCLL